MRDKHGGDRAQALADHYTAIGRTSRLNFFSCAVFSVEVRQADGGFRVSGSGQRARIRQCRPGERRVSFADAYPFV